MAYGIGDYQTALGLVVAALDGGEYSQARAKLARARVIHAALPEEFDIAGMKAKKNRVEELDGLERAIDLAQQAASGNGATQFVLTSFGGRV